MKRTKIICTLGPASHQPEVLKDMLTSGMNAIRINMSHGDHSQHKELIKQARKVASKKERALAVILDTQGPEIRIGKLKGKRLYLNKGDRVQLMEGDFVGDENKLPLHYPRLVESLKPKDKILIGDGEVELKVIKVANSAIICEARNSGWIGENKGIHVCGASFDIPSITDKDREDIRFAAKEGADYLAVSFARKPEDICEAREIVAQETNQPVEIIAKIESGEAWNNIDALLKVAEGIMVARGDLGLEFEPEEIPAIQKRLINKANRAGKLVITATQMLESMTNSPRPTRAEVTDVANAILDGTDAVMLSEETAVGEYPVGSVNMMRKIAQNAEKLLETYYSKLTFPAVRSVAEAIGQSAPTIADNIKASAIITSTRSGSTAKIVAKFRPQVTIIAVTPSEKVFNKLALIWGVKPLKIPFSANTDSMIENSLEAAKEAGLVKKGQKVVITAGVPFGIEGLTNLIEVQEV